MKRWFKFKYPKIMLLVICIILAYLVFRNPDVLRFISNLRTLGYLGTFIAGIFFAFGFSAPFAAGYFITLNPGNVWLAGGIGGLGALTGDLLIFNFIRISFKKEIESIKKTKLISEIDVFLNESIFKKARIYLMYAIVGLIIASPFPDEIGVIMLAGLTRIKVSVLAVVSFILNTLGILLLLWI